MLSYCRSDVDILRRCCMVFREQFMEIANVDPFRYVTIASACMATYRSGHIQDNSIAMVPIHGYSHGKQFSPDAIRWLDYISFTEKLKILHSLNGKGERKIGGNFVDGYCEENKTVYQYQGCFFHGCT
ncbi:DNA_pol_B_2 domain-containing protein, partial [Nephila pilipes]